MIACAETVLHGSGIPALGICAAIRLLGAASAISANGILRAHSVLSVCRCTMASKGIRDRSHPLVWAAAAGLSRGNDKTRVSPMTH